MNRRKPVAAAVCRAMPRFDQFAAGIALGSVALAGCKNPFELLETNGAEHRAGLDPAGGLASMFATTSIQSVADSHPSYPLFTVAAMHATSRLHAATTPAVPPPLKVTTPPVGFSSFSGGAMIATGPYPPTRHLARRHLASIGRP